MNKKKKQKYMFWNRKKKEQEKLQLEEIAKQEKYEEEILDKLLLPEFYKTILANVNTKDEFNKNYKVWKKLKLAGKI